MSEELKPCPFCGGLAYFERTGTRRQSCIVACTECGARHESADEWAHSGTAWNRRAEAAPIVPVAHVAEVHMSRYTIEWTNGPLAQGAPLYAAPIVPQGWRVVPMEPTPEMVQAYLNANNAYWVRVDEAPPIIGKWRNGTPSEATAESYRAMLAASPAPDADGVREGGKP